MKSKLFDQRKKNIKTRLILWAIKSLSNIFYFLGHPTYLLLRFLISPIIKLFNYLTTVIPAKAGIYINRFRVKACPVLDTGPGMTGKKRKLPKRYYIKQKGKKIYSRIILFLSYSLFLVSFFRIIIINLYGSIKNILHFALYILHFFSHLSKKNLLIGVLIIIISFLFLDIYYLYGFFRSLPSPTTLKTRKVALTTKIYDRNGELLYKVYDKSQNRSLISLEQLPKYLKQATIAIEDKDFYNHGALSVGGILRAARQNIHGYKQGGSTITQQLIKNVFLSPERSLDRKLKEAVLSVQTELIFTKDEILQMYFNEIGYGGTAYGVEEASQMYFGKPASQLNLAQSALLAGLPQAPTYYSPFGADPRRAKVRQEEVLRRMVEDGYITKKQAADAARDKLVFAPQKIDIKAPHFVMYVKDLLVQKYGEKMVEEGGLSVFTTLDINIQNMAQKEVTAGVTNQKYLAVGNGASLVTNPQTGEILAMVGSTDYFNQENDGNVNVTLMPRQPGSSIKPINYATAFLLRKITPATVIQDTPVMYRISDTENYAPQNYDSRFHGNVTVRTALANSLNIPAVKVLAGYGVDQMIDLGQKLGISTWEDKNRYGLSLTLGGGEIKMLDINVAFGTFANNGTKEKSLSVLKVFDAKGDLLEDHTPPSFSGDKVLSSGVAFIISNILADNNARSMIFGPNSPLLIPGHTVSVKTGTTESKKDNWTIGFTPDYVVAVWIGNNDSTPMSPALESGYSGAAPIWHNIMAGLLKDKKDPPISLPNDIIKIEVCSTTGLLACSDCPKKAEYFLAGTQPQNRCPPNKIENKPTDNPQVNSPEQPTRPSKRTVRRRPKYF